MSAFFDPGDLVAAPPAQRSDVLWSWSRIGWICAAFIALVTLITAWDIGRDYRSTVDAAARDLNSQAVLIAEQSGRSVQGIELVLRHIGDEYRSGSLAVHDSEGLRSYLARQAMGLPQIEGLRLLGAGGHVLARWDDATDDTRDNGTADNPGDDTRDDTANDAAPRAGGPRSAPESAPVTAALLVGRAARLGGATGPWVFPITRRVTNRSGQYVAEVVALARVEYFSRFYRDAHFAAGTQISLLHQDGTLLARQPAQPAALGTRSALFDAVLQQHAAGNGATFTSPLDHVQRIAALAPVSGYPLEVVVTRDRAAVLAPWLGQTAEAVLRTLALAALATVLMLLLRRQMAHLSTVRQSLLVSRERFALAVAGADVGIWDWDIAGNRLFASPRTLQIYGLEHRPGCPDGEDRFDAVPESHRAADAALLPGSRDEWFAAIRIHRDDVARRDEDIRAHLAGETAAYLGEYRVLGNDDVYRWVRVRGLCVRNAAGEPIRMAGSVTDIDSGKRAEGALRKSEERFALAVAGSDDGVWDFDFAADEAFASQRARQIMGLALQPEVQRSLQQWIDDLPMHSDDALLEHAAVKAHLAGLTPAFEGEWRFRRPDGGWRWVRVRGVCVRDAAGQPLRMACSVSDIDARKRTEEALRESEERYELAVAGSNEGLWDWNLVSDRLFLSPRAQKLLWLESVDPQQTRRYWIEHMNYHPADKPRVRAALSAHLHGQTRHFMVEYRLQHHSGAWHWYRQRGIAVRDAAGRPTRMAGSMEDISDRKNAESERAQLEVQLRQAQKLEAMGTLAGGIAHDFNNILSAILGYGELARKDAPSDTQLRRHIDAAISAGMRAKSLVERILAFSRGGVSERSAVHVQSVIGEALDAVAASLPPQMRLQRQLDAGDAAVIGDATQLHQVVMNLCANAVHAMRASGTLVVNLDRIELGTPNCATCRLPRGNYLRLSVRDSGSGIASDMLERIFDPFFTTKDVGVGTGLGLSLVHGIVRDLGGGIDVQSQIGEGSTFTVFLPRFDGTAPPERIGEAPAPNGHGETVLLVDDEEALVRMDEEMLAGLGYEPVGFSSATAALQAFDAEPQRFDAILSDEAMPQMTGSELARSMHRIRPGVPIVLMSGYVSSALTARAQAAGVIEVLAKPLASQDIARCLAGVFQRITPSSRPP